ncbi:hypothetical protein Gogos_021646 [Gossypium gossypioides]|uniref:Uncharacterized protein n=1 Tax=Gossypium gossypioides TaxID=34282 RepID=A0A7J9D5C0_GOSGO|nr:hypothetical protein [Gossypium gossypioides]
MRLSEYGPRQRSKRRVIVLKRVVLLLERWIWYLLWKSTRLCSVARRFKLIRLIPELPTSLNTCRKAGEGRFIGCAQLLLAWFHNYF